MALEISDCVAVATDYEMDRPIFEAHVPKGLAAVPDSISPPPAKAPKPNFIHRTAIHIGILFIHSITWTVRFFNWTFHKIFGYTCSQKEFYRQLHELAKKGDPDAIKEFLIEHSDEGHATSYLADEFLALPELYPHLTEILRGANICLVNDGGFFCRRWSDHPNAYRRSSSHAYQDKECYAIGHFLFWLDPAGQTRFQLEKSPFKGIFNVIDHSIDYLRYKRDNEQQGVMGASPHTEEYFLPVQVDPSEFIARKV